MGARVATGLSGVLVVDKPAGMTSHDVVSALRRASGERRIGHAGTLDPMATGVLVVLIGPATRLEPYVSSAEKGYEATIAFGTATDTDDAEGAALATLPVPERVFDPDVARELLARFVGTTEQVPPAYSAIKVDGLAAYRAARGGRTLQLAPRTVTVHEASLLAADAATGTWTVRLLVSKGTYVRALARDLGRAAGTVAHLAALRRVSAGAFDVSTDSHGLPTVLQAAEENRLSSLFADPFRALGLPSVEADPGAMRDGRALPLTAAQRAQTQPPLADGELVSVRHGNTLLAVYRVDAAAGALRAQTVIPGGVSGGAA